MEGKRRSKGLEAREVVESRSPQSFLMAFNFLPANYALSDQVLASLREVSSLDEATVLELCAVCLNALKQASLQSTSLQVKKVSETQVAAMLLFFKLATRKLTTSSALNTDLRNLGFSERITAKVLSLWEEEKRKVWVTAISRNLASSQLVDMEWKFGVTARSWQRSDGGDCFIHLKLVLLDLERRENTVFMELTLKEFYQLYGELERVKSILDLRL